MFVVRIFNLKYITLVTNIGQESEKQVLVRKDGNPEDAGRCNAFLAESSYCNLCVDCYCCGGGNITSNPGADGGTAIKLAQP